MAEQLTFEAAYADLERTLAELEDRESPPTMARTVELVARGKALERALGRFLEDCQGRLERIEAGDGLAELEIVQADGERAGEPAATVTELRSRREGDDLPLPVSPDDDDFPF